jgi:hypothetical protein
MYRNSLAMVMGRITLSLLHGLLVVPRALPMATDKLGSFKNIL